MRSWILTQTSGMMQSASLVRIEARTAKPPSAQKSCNSLHYRDISWIPRFQVGCSMTMKSQANSASQSCSVVSRIHGSFASYSMGFHGIPALGYEAPVSALLQRNPPGFVSVLPWLGPWTKRHPKPKAFPSKDHQVYQILTIKWWTMDSHDSGMIVLDHYISFLWMNFG